MVRILCFAATPAYGLRIPQPRATNFFARAAFSMYLPNSDFGIAFTWS